MMEIMLKSINKKKSNQKGFTLVELIVVIAILGILAAVAVGRFGGITKTAKENADYAAAATIAAAAEAARAADPTLVDPDVEALEGAGFLDKKVYNSQSEDGDTLDVTYVDGNPVVSLVTKKTQLFPKE